VTSEILLSEDEIRSAAGGYKRPADQLRALEDQGYWRAYRSKVTGRIVLPRAHFEAVNRGEVAKPAPKLRAVR
jgi:hypothetical protein